MGPISTVLRLVQLDSILNVKTNNTLQLSYNMPSEESALAAHLKKRVDELEHQLGLSKTAVLDEKAKTAQLQHEVVRLGDELRLKDAVISDLRSSLYEERKNARVSSTYTANFQQPDTVYNAAPASTPFALPATAIFSGGNLSPAPRAAAPQTGVFPLGTPQTAVLQTGKSLGVPMTSKVQTTSLEVSQEIPGFPFAKSTPEKFLKGERWMRGGLEPLTFRTAISGGQSFGSTLFESEQVTLIFDGHADTRECDFTLRVRAKQTISQLKVLPEATTGRASEFSLFLEEERVPVALIAGDEASFVGKFLVNRPYDRKVVLCVSLANAEGRVVDSYVTLPLVLAKFAAPLLGFEQADVLEAWQSFEGSEQEILVEKTRQGISSAEMFPGTFGKFDGLDGSGKGAVFGGKVSGELVLVRVELGQDVRCAEMAKISVRTASSGYLAKCVVGNFAALVAAPNSTQK